MVAAIDLGSNTFRALWMVCETRRICHRYEKIVRTADGMVQSGVISQAAIARIIEAALEAQASYGWPSKIKAVATQAMRKARNAKEALETIAQKSGLLFEVIDGSQEARYTWLAVGDALHRLGLEKEGTVCVDIGGGSTEVIYFFGGRLIAQSFPVGIVTVTQRFKTLDAIKANIAQCMAPIDRWIQARKKEGIQIRQWVATAGTPTTVAAVKWGYDYRSYDPNRINGTRLTRSDLSRIYADLLALLPDQRAALVGVGREDLIGAGILLFDHLYDLLGCDEAVVVDDGLREGVALSLCGASLAPLIKNRIKLTERKHNGALSSDPNTL